MKRYYFDFYINYGQGTEYSFTAKTEAEKQEAIAELNREGFPYPYTIKKQSTKINIEETEGEHNGRIVMNRMIDALENEIDALTGRSRLQRREASERFPGI